MTAVAPLPSTQHHSALLTSPRLSTARRSSALPPWFFVLVAVSFLCLTVSLLLGSSPSSSSSHPCPYADVLGLDTSSHDKQQQQQHGAAAVRSMPAGHSPVDGLSEDDCPHLAIERQAAQRRQEVQARRHRKELGVMTEEDRQVEGRERAEEDEMRRYEE